MRPQIRTVTTVYLVLTLLNTLAASLIWGINTLFLLDAGLSNTAAFTANAFFTGGMVLFEVPTGVVADTWGRRASFLLGGVVLAVSTVIYWYAWQIEAPFVVWAVSSILIGLGFTFFSGATEAWLVDALRFAGWEGGLEPVFAKGQVVGGAAMLTGAFGGGVIAQYTNLGVPYLLRSAALIAAALVALVYMKDWGFTPQADRNPLHDMRRVLRTSLEHGFGNPPVRWLMLSGAFIGGIAIYVHYAAQPYLLDLWGDDTAYSVAGIAAAAFGGAQILGGVLAARIRGLFRRRTSALLVGLLVQCLAIALLVVVGNFWLAIALLVVQGLMSAATLPIRQAFVNDLIPSSQRATVLSFDNLLSSAGGIVTQPALGQVADVSGYRMSFVISAAVQLLAAPFIYLTQRVGAAADHGATEVPADPGKPGDPETPGDRPATRAQ